jgi:hypothetical protein
MAQWPRRRTATTCLDGATAVGCGWRTRMGTERSEIQVATVRGGVRLLADAG